MMKSMNNVAQGVCRPKGVDSYKAYITKGMKQVRPEGRISKTDVAIAKKLFPGRSNRTSFGRRSGAAFTAAPP